MTCYGRRCGDLWNSTDFMLKVLAFCCLLSAFIMPYLTVLPVPLTSQKFNWFAIAFFCVTAGGGCIALLALMIIIYYDFQRHTIQLVVLTIHILLCLVVAPIFFTYIIKDDTLQIACAILIMFAGIFMLIDLLTEAICNSGYDCYCM